MRLHMNKAVAPSGNVCPGFSARWSGKEKEEQMKLGSVWLIRSGEITLVASGKEKKKQPWIYTADRAGRLGFHVCCLKSRAVQAWICADEQVRGEIRLSDGTVR